MAKSKVQEVDLAMAEDLELELSPFTLTLGHVQKLHSPHGGLLFAYHINDQIYYDRVEVQAAVSGRRVKPYRFLCPEMVKTRLEQRAYARWYFFDKDYLYPVQTCKVKALYESLWLVEVDDPHYRSSVVANLNSYHLRKKPLLAMRETPLTTWEDTSYMPTIVSVAVQYREEEAVA